MTKITHITSVHSRYDTRIFMKECSSLAKLDKYQITLLVADGKSNEIKNNVSIVSVKKENSRFLRILITSKLIYKKSLELDSEIYHIHDPELIPIGLKLEKKGKIIVFDVHENIVEQIKSKEYLSPFLRSVMSSLYKFWDKKVIDKFNIVLAENSYNDVYDKHKKNCITILNMPQIEILSKYIIEKRDVLCNEILYVGGVTKFRGMVELTQAVNILDSNKMKVKLNLIGPKFSDYIFPDFKNGSIIKEYGFLPLSEAYKISLKCKIGVSILHPISNYMKSYSTKIFEYMSIGLPVVTSNFELYKRIIDTYKCGICVDPLNPQEIADAINYIISNPCEAEKMGRNGIEAVKEMYNWQIEEKKLFKLYQDLSNE